MTQYNVTGMSCAACVARVEKAVSKIDGVNSCSVSLLTNSMNVDGSADSSAIINAVQNAGYGASLKGKEKKSADVEDSLKDTETPKIRKRLIASLIVLAVLMYFSMGHMMCHGLHWLCFPQSGGSGGLSRLLRGDLRRASGRGAL